MFSFLTFIFKIFITLVMTYLLFIFDPVDKKKYDYNKNLVLFSLFFICMLNFFFLLSRSDIDFNLSLSLIVSVLLLFLFVYFNEGDMKRYFVVYTLAHFISFGYIFMSVVIFSLYLFLDKYANKIEYYFNPSLEENFNLDERDEYIDE